MSTLRFTVVGINENDTLLVKIGDRDYSYDPVGMSTEQLMEKTMGICRHSAGKALAWLNKNATCLTSYKKMA